MAELLPEDEILKYFLISPVLSFFEITSHRQVSVSRFLRLNKQSNLRQNVNIGSRVTFLLIQQCARTNVAPAKECLPQNHVRLKFG